ncbi:yceG-like family protein, partial [Vibrio parahaemolyticus VPTS-2010]
RQV